MLHFSFFFCYNVKTCMNYKLSAIYSDTCHQTLTITTIKKSLLIKLMFTFIFRVKNKTWFKYFIFLLSFIVYKWTCCELNLILSLFLNFINQNI